MGAIKVCRWVSLAYRVAWFVATLEMRAGSVALFERGAVQAFDRVGGVNRSLERLREREEPPGGC